MDENARIFRICVWFKPPHPPISTDSILAPITRFVNTNSLIENKRISGAIFCHVAIIRPLENGSPCKTSGNQKWQGTSPILKASAVVTETEVTKFAGSRIDHEPIIQACMRAPFNMRAALMA